MNNVLSRRNPTRAGLAGLALALTCCVFPAAAQEVTTERLLNAQNEPQNWLLPYGSYDARNHSSLSEINKDNVGDLRVAFMYPLGGTNPSEEGGDPPNVQSTPVVNEGMMYVHNGWGEVLKVDVSSGTHGELMWINNPEVESPDHTRGSVALLGNHVFYITRESNARLIKVDAESGEKVWEVPIAPPAELASGASPSVQVMAIQDKLLVAFRGTRGSVAAFSSEDGAEFWRFWTVPAEGEPGNDSWADDWGAWKTGGAPVWTQASYDPETNLVYYGVAEAKPWGDPEFRPGDNLYSNSVVALDLDSGELKWHYQVVPNDTHDRDNVSMRMLYDAEVDGQMRKVLGQFTRGGFYYTWDRATGEFLTAAPYTDVNWTSGIDIDTGKPNEYDTTVTVQMYGGNKSLRAGKPEFGQNVCPNWIGSPTLMPPTYDASNNTAYIGAATGCYSSTVAAPYEHTDIKLGESRNFPGLELITDGHQAGRMVAIDVQTGEVKGEKIFDWPLYSGTLGTDGGLLFTAQADGWVYALDKDTLEELWSFNVGTIIAAPPITYSVNGKQFVAIVVGGALYRPNDFMTQDLTDIPRGAAQVVVFGL